MPQNDVRAVAHLQGKGGGVGPLGEPVGRVGMPQAVVGPLPARSMAGTKSGRMAGRLHQRKGCFACGHDRPVFLTNGFQPGAEVGTHRNGAALRQFRDGRSHHDGAVLKVHGLPVHPPQLGVADAGEKPDSEGGANLRRDSAEQGFAFRNGQDFRLFFGNIEMDRVLHDADGAEPTRSGEIHQDRNQAADVIGSDRREV